VNDDRERHRQIMETAKRINAAYDRIRQARPHADPRTPRPSTRKRGCDMIRLRVAPDGSSLLLFCDECDENLEALGETPTAAKVAAAIKTIHPTCQWPKRWGTYPQANAGTDRDA
jgi:hypothetical protein